MNVFCSLRLIWKQIINKLINHVWQSKFLENMFAGPC